MPSWKEQVAKHLCRDYWIARVFRDRTVLWIFTLLSGIAIGKIPGRRTVSVVMESLSVLFNLSVVFVPHALDYYYEF